jgi:hypothetical protein
LGGRFVPWDVFWGTFCALGRFLGRSVLWDV